MTEITSPEVSITAEDAEFLPAHVYRATHQCGVRIIALGSDMHDAIVDHTARCQERNRS